jgi:hypothetical protein
MKRLSKNHRLNDGDKTLCSGKSPAEMAFPVMKMHSLIGAPSSLLASKMQPEARSRLIAGDSFE